MNLETKCGKWIIGHNEDGGLYIVINRHPIDLKLSLYDLSIQDIFNLENMFKTLADRYRLDIEKEKSK